MVAGDQAQTVEEIMAVDPVCVDGATSARDVAQAMRDGDIGDVIVTSDGTVRGVVTDRDIVIRIVADGGDPSAVTVGEVCSSELVTADRTMSISDALGLMREHAIRRLPVLEDQRPVGILSLGDLAIERDETSALSDISAAPPNT